MRTPNSVAARIRRMRSAAKPSKQANDNRHWLLRLHWQTYLAWACSAVCTACLVWGHWPILALVGLCYCLGMAVLFTLCDLAPVINEPEWRKDYSGE